MLNSIKRWILISIVAVSFCVLSGCTGSQYHDGNGKEWIMEQVQQGKLTQEQADELLKQESADE
jgi:hypothetical protein